MPTAQHMKTSENKNIIKKRYRAKWDYSKQAEFKNAFNADVINELMNNLDNTNASSVTQHDIDSVTKHINDVYKEAGLLAGIVNVFQNAKFTNHKLMHKTTLVHKRVCQKEKGYV